MLTRRNFLAACGGTAVLAQLAPGRLLAAPATDAPAAEILAGGTPAEALFNPSRAAFARLLGEGFLVPSSTGGTHRLALAAVEEHGNSCCTVEQFTLEFHALDGAGLESGIHTLSHPEAGSADVYLERITQAESAPRYRAAFALLRETA